jgi:hypothetical protein
LLDKPLKTIGQNIRRNPFHGLGQELAKMPAVHENDVADNEQTPLVAKYLDREVDNALRPVILGHSASTPVGRCQPR